MRPGEAGGLVRADMEAIGDCICRKRREKEMLDVVLGMKGKIEGTKVVKAEIKERALEPTLLGILGPALHKVRDYVCDTTQVTPPHDFYLAVKAVGVDHAIELADRTMRGKAPRAIWAALKEAAVLKGAKFD